MQDGWVVPSGIIMKRSFVSPMLVVIIISIVSSILIVVATDTYILLLVLMLVVGDSLKIEFNLSVTN